MIDGSVKNLLHTSSGQPLRLLFEPPYTKGFSNQKSGAPQSDGKVCQSSTISLPGVERNEGFPVNLPRIHFGAGCAPVRPLLTGEPSSVPQLSQNLANQPRLDYQPGTHIF